MQNHAPRRWRGGAMGTSRPTATGPHHGARRGGTCSKPRTAPVARRRDGDIAPYRDGTAQRGMGERGRWGGGGVWGAAARSIMGKMTDSFAFAFVFDFLFVAKIADDLRFYLFFLDNLGYFPVYESSFPKFNSIRLI